MRHIKTYERVKPSLRSQDIELWQNGDGSYALRFSGSTDWWTNPDMAKNAEGIFHTHWDNEGQAINYVHQTYGKFGGVLEKTINDPLP